VSVQRLHSKQCLAWRVRRRSISNKGKHHDDNIMRDFPIRDGLAA
jgi:hypothetical protein